MVTSSFEQPLSIPKLPQDLTPEFLSAVVNTMHPGTTVKSLELLDVKRYGETMVSTSDRLKMQLTFDGRAAADLPSRVVVKMHRLGDPTLSQLYANEVAFYVRVRPGLDIEAPKVVGGIYDEATFLYYLFLEDLSLRGATFPTALRETSVDEVWALLAQLAKLHASFWNSPRLRINLAWYQTHLSGSLAASMDRIVPLAVAENIRRFEPVRRIVDALGGDIASLHAKCRALQLHQSKLPQTLLHGDCHIGNTYLLPDGSAGLLDFQLSVLGAWVHDVSYIITTALPVGTRRQHERELLDAYLEMLAERGATEPPAREKAWLEYRRALFWNLYVGWLPTPPINYGDRLASECLLRTFTAIEDHDTLALLDALS